MARYFNDLADVGDELGFRNPFRRRRKKRSAATNSVPAARLIPNVPGVPSRGLREQPLAMGATSFTASSGTALVLTATPQRPFRGRRLILDISRNGTSSTGLVTVTSFDVGADNQLPTGRAAMPAAAFGPTAVGTNLDIDPATPGVIVTIGLAISAAPTMTDTVDVSGLIIGETAS